MPKAKTKRREMMKNKRRVRKIKRGLMQRTTKVQEVEEVLYREYEKFN